MSNLESQQTQPKSSYQINVARPDRTIPQPTQAENPILAQQQTWGNQAAHRFAQACPLRLPSPGACPLGGACHACPAPVQAKLQVNAPGDQYEQEADRVADQVMRMPEPRVQRQAEPEEEEEPVQALTGQTVPLVQRQAEPEEGEEEEEPIQTKPIAEQITPLVQRQVEPEEEEEPIQTKRAGGQAAQVSHGLATQIHSLRGGGQPLPPSARGFFEPRFGRDFSQVRVHAGMRAAQAARAISARAFTVGQDVVFGAGQYAPETAEGGRLLAHELTHVVQQSSLPAQTPNLQRAEIDDKSSGCVGLQDIEGDIDSRVNGVLHGLRNEPDGSRRARAIYNALGTGSPYTRIERWIESLPNTRQRRIKIAQTRYRIEPFRYSPRGARIDTLRHRSGSGNINAWWWKGEETLGVLTNIAGHCVGSDKLGHFFQQGYDYFQISTLLGKGDIYAKGFGQWLEGRLPAHPGVLAWLAQMTARKWPGFAKVGPFRPFKEPVSQGVFGLSTTGVYSKADLAANEAGLLFYKSVYASPDVKFSIRSYITGQWREELNPSCYNRDIAAVVAANDPQFQAKVRQYVRIAMEQNRMMGAPGLSQREGIRIYHYILQDYIRKYQCQPGFVPIPTPPQQQQPPPHKPVPPEPPKKTPITPKPDDQRGATSVLWFKFNSATLRQDKEIDSTVHMQLALERIRQHLLAVGNKARIVLHGYASVEGDRDYNQRLSLHRAKAIRDKLVGAGISASVISIQAHGRDTSYSPRSFNRRVEIEHVVTK